MATKPTTPPAPNHPVIDADGTYMLELECGNLSLPGGILAAGEVQAAPGFTVDRRKRCRTTPLGGEKLPAPVAVRVSIPQQEAQNRGLFVLALMLIVAASPVAVACAAILLGGMS